jgi:hypothetical protein
MKKVLVLLCGLLLVSGVYAAGNEMSFGINFGAVTDDSFSFNPFLWTVGAELDLQIGNYLMFSPEVTLIGYKFEFKEFNLYPAAILNFTASNFFVGGGITKGFYIGSGTAGDFPVCLKLNAGMMSKNIKLTAYLITPFDELFEKGMLVGASLGFKF